MDIFSYIPVIVGVRAKDFTPVLTRATVTGDLESVHKRLLTKLHSQGYPCAMVFQNELYLMRSLQDLNNNEIKTFLMTNPAWDVLILSPFVAQANAVPGMQFIQKVDNSSDFFCGEIYIASERFMEKVTTNNMGDIQTYVYTKPFLQDMDSTSSSQDYTIGHISNIIHLRPQDIKYTWNEYQI